MKKLLFIVILFLSFLVIEVNAQSCENQLKDCSQIGIKLLTENNDLRKENADLEEKIKNLEAKVILFQQKEQRFIDKEKDYIDEVQALRDAKCNKNVYFFGLYKTIKCEL